MPDLQKCKRIAAGEPPAMVFGTAGMQVLTQQVGECLNCPGLSATEKQKLHEIYDMGLRAAQELRSRLKG